MKILFVFYIPSGGVETLNRQRCNTLKKHGIECHQLYLENGTGMQNILDIPTFIMKGDAQINELLNREQYQCIIVCSNYMILPRIRAAGFKGSLIYEVQGLGSKENAKDILIHAKPFVHANGNGLLYPKTPHLNELIQKYYKDMPQFCFHNLMDTEHFTYQENNAPEYPVIGWVGRIEENKNWRSFLEIGAALKQHKPNLKLWMFEDATLSKPAERNRFTQLLQQLNMSGYIETFSNIPHEKMADYYSKIGNSGGFLLSTSKVEGFGYAVAEAISCRCPVLTTDSDGVRAFIIHNQSGKFFTAGDTAHAVREALDLMDNTHLRDAIKTNALNHLNANCSPAQYAVNFKQMLRTLGHVIT
ncbi:glycosyltransferase family 4 protein [Fictibacillus aquaticus]|uniref:Glycosyl transferase family 1 domain-containing protein n=1 Tax=Fictibacillus aquaticus TaxID=2021314 RepID=A0A235FDM4_9BACL|nr:glycosyltransferase [Fictibacillus aquaticus]OYD59043.1 hypothetical protein CGZ90_03835 [Fictibacillus aquaticus]